VGKLVPESPTILDFTAARDDGSDTGANWNSKTCTAPVRSPLPAYQHSVSTGQIPFCHPTNSVKALRVSLTSYISIAVINDVNYKVISVVFYCIYDANEKRY